MNSRAVAIHATRATYAMNWYNISPGLVFIAKDLSLSISQVGFLVTVFYIGVGLFQLPAGYLATKFGNRNIASLGILLLGISGILSSISSGFFFLAMSRLIGGVASAMFFAPAMGNLRSVTGEDSYSFHVNLFNGAFSVGAASGIAGWEVLDEYTGWRFGFLIAGIITIAFSAVYYFALRNLQEERTSHSPSRTMAGMLVNRVVWILALAGTAAVISENVAAVLVTYYLETAMDVVRSLASISGTLFLIFGFVGGVIGGVVADRKIGVKPFFILMALTTSILMIAVAFVHNLILIYVIFSVLGAVTTPAFSAIYVLIARSLPEKAQTTSSMSVVNGIQEIPGFIWPYAFTVVSASVSFAFSWILIGVISLAFLALVLLPSVRALK